MKKKNNYTKGRGVRLRINRSEISNLYHPTQGIKAESLDYVSISNMQEHRLLHIALKEWFFLVKSKGYLEVKYIPSEGLTFDFLEKSFWWLFKGNYSIVDHKISKKQNILIIQKQFNQLTLGDSITKWTFGIVTNGDRDDWVEQIIASIRKQRIPSYEIIICGRTNLNLKYISKNIIYIPFNERAERGWISKKKNLICEKAQYENLCILHDRIVLDNNWYSGMKKWGNAYELLGCVQKEENGTLSGDWITHGGDIGDMWKVSRLKYSDWDCYTYLSGQLTLIKKSIWQRVLWDETRYWNDAEDADISFRARDMGYVVRFNPFAETKALSWRHGKLPLKYYRSDGILPKDMLFRRAIRVGARTVYSIPGLKKIPPEKYLWFFNTKLYKYFAYH